MHTSLVELLPHQITAVYESMLPRQPLRFLLADDPSAGKTIMAGLLMKELARDEQAQAKLAVPDNRHDLVVIDEAHKLSASFFGGEITYTKRYRLGQLVSGLMRHFLLMTATPHNGKEDTARIAEEVITYLVNQAGAEMTVTLEIEARLPNGASDQIVRIVTENGKALKFTNCEFEE